ERRFFMFKGGAAGFVLMILTSYIVSTIRGLSDERERAGKSATADAERRGGAGGGEEKAEEGRVGAMNAGEGAGEEKQRAGGQRREEEQGMAARALSEKLPQLLDTLKKKGVAKTLDEYKKPRESPERTLTADPAAPASDEAAIRRLRADAAGRIMS